MGPMLIVNTIISLCRKTLEWFWCGLCCCFIFSSMFYLHGVFLSFHFLKVECPYSPHELSHLFKDLHSLLVSLVSSQRLPMCHDHHGTWASLRLAMLQDRVILLELSWCKLYSTSVRFCLYQTSTCLKINLRNYINECTSRMSYLFFCANCKIIFIISLDWHNYLVPDLTILRKAKS